MHDLSIGLLGFYRTLEAFIIARNTHAYAILKTNTGSTFFVKARILFIAIGAPAATKQQYSSAHEERKTPSCTSCYDVPADATMQHGFFTRSTS